MSSRTYGATRNCAGCRFWSEMVARAHAGRPVEAMCLNRDSPEYQKYMAAVQDCRAWASGHRGAVDEPGTDGTEYGAED